MGENSNRETICIKCVHCQVCAYKSNYLTMIKRLKEVFYSVPEDDRYGMTFNDPDCKFLQLSLERSPLNHDLIPNHLPNI